MMREQKGSHSHPKFISHFCFLKWSLSSFIHLLTLVLTGSVKDEFTGIKFRKENAQFTMHRFSNFFIAHHNIFTIKKNYWNKLNQVYHNTIHIFTLRSIEGKSISPINNSEKDDYLYSVYN